ncbi:MAG: hypothetical protein KIH89_000925 [Candidatus Shapirobacteria bacterium]|nr:hypothetical protein [Candidatus Shapirobacteria bacterium]
MIESMSPSYSDSEDEYFSYCLSDPKWLPTYSQLIQQFRSLDSSELAYTLRSNDIRFIHEFFNQEFVEQLSLYLIHQFQDPKLQPRKVLEICAGDGLLSHHLNQQLKPFNIESVPTDSKTNRIPEWFPVKKLNHQQAIETHPYPIVLCSWMPKGLDLTPDLRNASCISEYILIGDPQVCGHPIESWLEEYPNFRRHPINSAHQFQFGLTDSPIENIFKSQIFSFRRTV